MSTMKTGPTEREARKVAEAARETEWTKPSFGKELFLGRLRLDLVDPWPSNSPEQVAAGEAFLERLRPYVETIDGAAIEREASIPDDVFSGLAELGAFGMKLPTKYGGLGLSHLYYCKALTLAGSANGSIGTAHVAQSVPDGHTLLLATLSHVTNPLLQADVRWNPVTDFAGVAMLATAPVVARSAMWSAMAAGCSSGAVSPAATLRRGLRLRVLRTGPVLAGVAGVGVSLAMPCSCDSGVNRR